MPTLLIRRFALISCSLALIGGGCWNRNQAPVIAPVPVVTPTPSSTPSTTSTTATPTTPAIKTTVKPKPAPKPVTNTVYVQILSGRFSPQIIAAVAGDTVVWTNKDTVPHTTRSDGSLLWDTGTIAPGKSASHTFPSKGSYQYSDANTGIKGTVIIN